MKRRDVDILKVLIEKGEERTNINQLSKELKMNYKNVYSIVKRLEKEGLISSERFGKSTICILNKKPHPLIFRAEHERREKLLENKNFKILYEKLNSLAFSFIALIFGSYAKGKFVKGSDIDLMVICEKNKEKEIKSVVSLLPLNIHLVTLTYGEFLKMAKSKEFSVVSEAMKINIILIGIEDYYRLIKNVE